MPVLQLNIEKSCNTYQQSSKTEHETKINWQKKKSKGKHWPQKDIKTSQSCPLIKYLLMQPACKNY